MTPILIAFLALVILTSGSGLAMLVVNLRKHYLVLELLFLLQVLL